MASIDNDVFTKAIHRSDFEVFKNKLGLVTFDAYYYLQERLGNLI
jgi:hypothetical protein